MEIETNRRRYRQRVSTVELFAVLEALLPIAEVELDCLADYVKDFPDDPDHAQDAERVRRGKLALELAQRLIARKSAPIRYRQRQFERAHLDVIAQGGSAPPTTDGARPAATDSAAPHGE